MTIPIKNNWYPMLKQATSTKSYLELRTFLKKEYETQTIYPEMDNIWTAYQWTDFEDVKVVIIGQDPYHGPQQAHGLSFSVQPGIKIPPSLRNIYKELQDDLNIEPVSHGYLKKWADQGVFMLNSVLTVRAGEPHSHRGKGWEQVTDFSISALNKKEKPVVFILWGAAAQKKEELIDTSKHYIIRSAHPSPLAAYRGFFGSKPFSKTNEILEETEQTPIDWQLPQKV